MLIYFTYRPLRVGSELLTPCRTLREGFAGLPIEYETLGINQAVDGRGLAWFEFATTGDAARDADVQQAIEDALLPFAYHRKTTEGAASFYEAVTGQTPTIDGDRLILPEPPSPFHQ